MVLDASLLLLTPPVPFIYPPPLLLLFYSLLSFALTLLWFSLLISLFLPSLLSLPLYHNPHPLASFLSTHTFLLPLLPFPPFLPLTLYHTANKTENSGKMTYIFYFLVPIFTHTKSLFLDSLHKETFRGNFQSNTGFLISALNSKIWSLKGGIVGRKIWAKLLLSWPHEYHAAASFFGPPNCHRKRQWQFGFSKSPELRATLLDSCHFLTDYIKLWWICKQRQKANNGLSGFEIGSLNSVCRKLSAYSNKGIWIL